MYFSVISILLLSVLGIALPAHAAVLPELDGGTLAAVGSGISAVLIGYQMYRSRKNSK